MNISVASPLRWTPLLFLWLLVLFPNTSCTFVEGNPWGYLELSVSQSPIKVPDSIVITSQDLHYGSIRAYHESTSSLDSNSRFDPASPPPGYSLCHNNHCHADDGSLVSYNEIIEETQHNSPSAPLVVGVSNVQKERLGRSDTQIQRIKITTQGTVAAIGIELKSITVSGTVVIDEIPTPFTMSIPLAGLSKSTQTTFHFDSSTPLEQTTALQISYPQTVFSEIDWQALSRRTDGSILIATTSNRIMAEKIIEDFVAGIDVALYGQ